MVSLWNGTDFPKALCAALLFVVPAATAAAEGEQPALDGAILYQLLEANEISLGGSDAMLRDPASGMQSQTYGEYAVFSMSGLDTTDNFSLISKDGAFIYANYESCSDSKTFFRSHVDYLRYLMAVR